jgi:uracil-DNA glycosylase family 4
LTYRAIGLPNTCSNCHLSNPRIPPIWGQAEIPLSNIRGIIISAYSGKEEEKEKKVLVEAPGYLNAGGFLRRVIRSITDDIDMDNNFFFTNALSCSVKNNKKETKTCIEKCGNWTQFEISKCNSKAPILVASSEAVTQLFGSKASINKLRNEVGLTYAGRPCVVTWNPITPLRYLPKNEDETPVLPVPIYSHTWLFKQDMIRFLTLAGVI